MSDTTIEKREAAVPAAEDGAVEAVRPGPRNEMLRNAALSPGVDRDRLYEKHPLVTNSVRFPTEPVKETYDEISRALLHRDPGTCFVADFRTGKTTAIGIIAATLRDTLSDLAVGVVIAKHHKTAVEAMFYADMLGSFRHKENSGKSMVLRKRVLEMVRNQAHRANTDRFLLLVDEGQNWGEEELTWLRDLTNDWANGGLTVITVIFAHPQLEDLIQNLKQCQRRDLIGRFLLSPRVFRGLSSKQDFLKHAAMYDDVKTAEYPETTGICYSEFFMPEAWRGGWRFEKEVSPMFNAFKSAMPSGQRGELNVGMNWISGATRNFFFSQQQNDSIAYQSTAEVWADAVAGCGYEASFI